MTKPTLPRVAVLGAGPIGLEAALYAKTLGLPVTLYDQGAPAAHVERWGHVRMFTPFGMNATKLGKQTLYRESPKTELPGDADLLTAREFRDRYLLPLAASPLLHECLQPQTRVMAIGRTGWRKSDQQGQGARGKGQELPPFRMLLRDAKGTERFDAADVILDCTGTLGRPNWLGDGGIPAAGELAARPHFTYWLDDVLGAKRAHYANKSIVLIGGGYSAGTTIGDLATLAETEQATWVVWLTKAPRGQQPLPRIANDPVKERDRLAVRANHLAARCDGNLEYHSQVCLDEVTCHGPEQGFRVTARIGGVAKTWEVERVIANVGYRPDLSLSAELRVEELAGRIETAEPGYFVLGAKAAGRDSSFLLRDGHEHIRKAFALILGKGAHDLYAKKAA